LRGERIVGTVGRVTRTDRLARYRGQRYGGPHADRERGSRPASAARSARETAQGRRPERGQSPAISRWGPGLGADPRPLHAFSGISRLCSRSLCGLRPGAGVPKARPWSR